MDKQKIKTQLNELRMELAYMRGMLENLSVQMQELQDSSKQSSINEIYEHPWYTYKREQLLADKKFHNQYIKN